jgi:choice-of-anchor C domain-containing protein
MQILLASVHDYICWRNKMARLLISTIAFVVLCFNITYAQIIKNGSFESATRDPGNGWIGVGPGNPVITDWTVTSGSIDYVGGLWVASDGKRSVDLNSSIPGAISQSFKTSKDSVYQLQFDMAGNPDGGRSLKRLRVTVADSSREFTFTPVRRDSMGWKVMAFKFTAIDSLTTLTFTSLTSGAYGPVIDKVRVDFLTYVEETANVPRLSFTLEQNYPNPFNPETTILYELPHAGQVEIAIFNLLGERVRLLVNQRQAAGQYRILWDGRNENGKSMPSGVYLYRLRAGEFVQTRKMILMQ